jgi:uncharacterized protein DUF4224
MIEMSAAAGRDDAFLTTEEVRRLTGYKYASCQAKYLMQLDIRFTRNRFGEVIVPRSAIDGKKEVEDDAPFVLRRIK